jgi:hypothetical protein
MKNAHILQIAFVKMAAEQAPKPMFEGVDLENGLGTVGAGAGAVLGLHGGAEASPHLTRMADNILPAPKEEAGFAGKLKHILEGKKSIVPPGSEGWIPDAIKHTGMNKAHGSKMMAVLALLAPFLGAGAGGVAGHVAGKDIGRTLDGKQ